MTDPEPTPVHHYRASVQWAGSTGGGYEAYDRDHVLLCPAVDEPIEMSSDPAFRGNGALLNPEQLLLAAAASCQLLSFLAAAARARVDVVDYTDDAEAVMPEDDRPVRITEIRLRPVITVHPGPSEERIRHLLDVAHRECFIANSLSSTISIDATVLFSPEKA